MISGGQAGLSVPEPNRDQYYLRTGKEASELRHFTDSPL